MADDDPPRATMEAERASEIRARVEEWTGDAIDESSPIRSGLTTAIAWVLTCSPRSSSVEQLALATTDLQLWFLCLDDYRGADYEDFFGCVERCLEGASGARRCSSSAMISTLRLFEEHIHRLTAYGGSLHRYRAERVLALQYYVRRNREREQQFVPSYEHFLEIREVSTLFRVWYSLWEVLSDARLTDEQYESPRFQRALRAVTRWHVLMNELHSVGRDVESGTPNLVLCLERDRSLSRSEAVASMLAECEDLVVDLETAWSEMGKRRLDAGHMKQSFDFLRLNIEGGRALYRLDLERYAYVET